MELGKSLFALALKLFRKGEKCHFSLQKWLTQYFTALLEDLGPYLLTAGTANITVLLHGLLSYCEESTKPLKFLSGTRSTFSQTQLVLA